jgi:hypothetical protein
MCGLAAAAVAVLAAMIPALPAMAIGIGGNGGFSLIPAPGSDGRTPAYFTMTAAPGDSVTGTVILGNSGQTTERLRVAPSTGVTAANGGIAYEVSSQRCSGTGCWVTGLPGVVTLPGGGHEVLHFAVRVPAGIAHGQYLAGLTAEQTAPARSVKVGSNGNGSARAIITEQISVGVAVTVGSLSHLTTSFRIPGVTGVDIGPTARLNIQLDNTGQTFAHAAGRASCTAAGARHSFAITPATILPQQGAQIAVNAPGLPEGKTVLCTVVLDYGNGMTARWAGPVALPAAPRTRIVHTGPGSYTALHAGSGILPWLIALLALVIAILAVTAVVLRRRIGRLRSP